MVAVGTPRATSFHRPEMMTVPGFDAAARATWEVKSRVVV